MFSAKSPFNNFVEKSIHMIDLKNSLISPWHSATILSLSIMLHNFSMPELVNKLIIIVNNRLYVSSLSIAADTSCVVRCFGGGSSLVKSSSR